MLNSWCRRSAAWDQGQGPGAALQHLPSGSPQRWQCVQSQTQSRQGEATRCSISSDTQLAQRCVRQSRQAMSQKLVGNLRTRAWASHAGGALRPVPWVAHAALALLQEGQDVLRAEDTHMSIAANKVKANHLTPFSMEKCSVRPSWSSGDISKSSKLWEARGKYPPSPASTPWC